MVDEEGGLVQGLEMAALRRAWVLGRWADVVVGVVLEMRRRLAAG